MRTFAFLIALLGLLGCRLVDPAPKGRSPLAPLVISPDAIALEVFSVPAPLGDPQMAALWTEVDEQPLPADLRARLAQNGLRAGVVGNTVPDALAALLKVTDERISADDRALVPIEAEEGIALTVMQPRIGEAPRPDHLRPSTSRLPCSATLTSRLREKPITRPRVVWHCACTARPTAARGWN